MKLKSECGEKLSHIKETTSHEIALLQEELRQQQLIINEKLVTPLMYQALTIRGICNGLTLTQGNFL